MSPSLVDVLSWEVRVSLPAALAWMYVTLFGAVLLGRRRQRASDRRYYRAIAESVRAERPHTVRE